MHSNAFFVTTAIGALLASTSAHAQSTQSQGAQTQSASSARAIAPAHSYVDRSLSLLGGATLHNFVALDTEYISTGLRVDGELRWISRGWMIAPRLGVDGSITTAPTTTGPSSALSASIAPGVAFGLVRPLANNITLGVAVSYRFEAGASLFSGVRVTRLAHSGAIEAPLTIFVSPNAFVEPALSVAITHTQSRAENVGASIGLRAGYTF